MKKLKKDLITARELKTAGKNRQAFEIYESHSGDIDLVEIDEMVVDV